jgi:hypothetical protein
LDTSLTSAQIDIFQHRMRWRCGNDSGSLFLSRWDKDHKDRGEMEFTIVYHHMVQSYPYGEPGLGVTYQL